MRSNSRCLILATLVLLWTAPVRAGSVSEDSDGSIKWQAGVDGVELEWSPDGSKIKRIYSRYSTPVEFGDRRGVATAQVIAEEKAKAGIIRFLQQSVASTRVVTEIEADLNKATQDRQTGTSPTVKKVDQRTLVSALTEVTASFAAGTLPGVIVLEKGYDDKADVAWVVVGISEKTINAANAAKTMISEPAGPTKTENGALGIQGSEVRHSNQKDW